MALVVWLSMLTPNATFNPLADSGRPCSSGKCMAPIFTRLYFVYAGSQYVASIAHFPCVLRTRSSSAYLYVTPRSETLAPLGQGSSRREALLPPARLGAASPDVQATFIDTLPDARASQPGRARRARSRCGHSRMLHPAPPRG